MNAIDFAIAKYAHLTLGLDLAMVREDAISHLDGKKALRKISSKRPGKKCGNGYVAADKQCKGHSAKTESGKRKLTAAGKKSAEELAAKVRARKGMKASGEINRLRLLGLDDRIEAAQKIVDKPKAISAANKGKETKARRKQDLTPQNTNFLNPDQARSFYEQGASAAKSEGRASDQKQWEKQAKTASRAGLKLLQEKANTTQSELFGIEETSSLPLFSSKRRDGIAQAKKQCGKGWEGLKPGCRRKKAAAKPTPQKSLAQNNVVKKTSPAKVAKQPTLGQQKALETVKAKPSALAELDPNTIEVDPKRFQYKIIGEHTASGEVGSLSGVRKYDPNLAGILQVWRDPEDGKTYVVNGHNRLALAKRLGAEDVAVRYLDVPDAKTARSVGALTNIAEGRGDALDAAKFFRDTGISRQDLEQKGIPMREKIAQDGLALSKLDDTLFRRTIDGELTIARAAIIGGSGLDDTQQRDLAKLIDKEGKRKNLTDAAIQEMVDIAKSSNTYQEQTMSLFGFEEVAKSNMIEKAKLQAAIKKRLSREKNLFGVVSRGTAAKDLSRGGNQIDVERSGEISDKAQQALNVFDKMKNLSGPISSAINAAADRIANGESQRNVEKDLYEEILRSEFIGGTKRNGT